MIFSQLDIGEVDSIFAGMTGRERFALVNGLNNESQFEQLADQLGISLERFKGIYVKGMNRLKHPTRAAAAKKIFELIEGNKEELQAPDIILVEDIKNFKEIDLRLMERLKRGESISKLDPLAFEHLVAELLASYGFYNVKWVGRLNNYISADILATNVVIGGQEKKYYIEVKNVSGRIGIEVVSQLRGSWDMDRCLHEKMKSYNHLMFVSISGFKNFKKTSKQELNRLWGIEFKERDHLEEMLACYEPRESGLLVPGRTDSFSMI